MAATASPQRTCARLGNRSCNGCWRRVLLTVTALAIFAVMVGQASASTRGAVTISTRGLPRGQAASIVISGPGYHGHLSVARATVRGLRPGTYVLDFRPVLIKRGSDRVITGATAYPAKGRFTVRVRSRRTTRLVGVYSGIVNPTVKLLPNPVLSVVGNAKDPLAVVLPAGTSAPAVGTIFTSAPSATLPYGLVSRVTRRTRQGGLLLVSLRAVPVADATPELSFQGSLPLEPSAAAASASAHISSNCSSPSLLDFGAHLDSVEVRRAFLGAWPPQLELTVAVRTTESLGVSAAALGINCDWTIAELGPYQEAIPVGPIVVPVYATFPVTAGIHVNGTLNVGTFNVASTTVANVAAGGDYNEASLTQQGSNVWVSGSPSISGSAKLSTSIGVQAGIGVAKAANVHLQADFGPELDWTSGQDCKLLLNMGSLSAGVSVFGRSLNTPSFTPWQAQLWSGCHPSASPGPGPTSGPTPSPTTPEAPITSTPAPPQPPPAAYFETTGGVTHTWTNYTNAGGNEGPSIPSNATVQIACKLTGFRVEDGNTWWYRIASGPWSGSFYASADAFYNNGETSGSLKGTPFVDPGIPDC